MSWKHLRTTWCSLTWSWFLNTQWSCRLHNLFGRKTMPNKLKKSCETRTQFGKYYLPIMTLCQKMLTIPWCHNDKFNIRFHLFVITWFFKYYMYAYECITCPLLIIYVIYRCRGKYHEKIVGWVTYPQNLIGNDFHFHCHFGHH
jgi:hypothetical protein